LRHAQVTGGLGLGAVALKRLPKDLGLDLPELFSQIAILELQSNGPGSFWRSVRVTGKVGRLDGIGLGSDGETLNMFQSSRTLR
jgi:hypothetical protein